MNNFTIGMGQLGGAEHQYGVPALPDAGCHRPAQSRTCCVQAVKGAKYEPDCDAAPKREKASVYVEGLLKHGGPSTDVFKKGIGEEKTAELFRKVLFATE